MRKCPKCGSGDTGRRGLAASFYTLVEVYLCRSCGRVFEYKNGELVEDAE